jgi:opacity protein-like surface antigen
MTNFLKTTVSLAALCVGIAAAPMAANAKDAKGSYVGVYGGANWNDVIEVPFVDNDTGYVVGGVLGTSVPAVKGLRIEGDLSFRQNEIDVAGFLKANYDTTALLGNVVYDFPANEAFGGLKPYALFGAGYAKTEVTFENVGLLKLENSGFAWQLGAGVGTELAEGVNLDIGYRYFQGPSLEVLGTELSDGSSDSVVATVRFAL